MSNNLRTRNGMPFNFVNGLKVRGMDIESLIPGIEGIPEAGSKYQFAGDGTNKSFTLPVSPYNKDAVDVYVKQLYVHPDDYTLVGDTVTLVEAPPTVVAGETYNVVVKVSLTTLNGYVNANRVSFEGENLDAVLAKSKPLANYSNLRAYAGAATQVRITDPGIAGFFYYDPSDMASTDNGGTIIVAGNGKRWKRLFDGAVNVKWFGAKGDWNGVSGTDDTVAIQGAINFAASQGSSSIVAIPYGTYIFTSILVKTGVTFLGQGGILRLKNETCQNSTTAYYLINNIGHTNVTYENLVIDGNRSNNQLFLVADAITAVGANVVVRGCRITNTPDSGIMFSDAPGGRCIDNIIDTGGDLGIYINAPETTPARGDMLCSGNVIKNFPFGGIGIKRSIENCAVVNNVITYCGNGITVEDFGIGNGGAPDHLLITGNLLKDIGYTFRDTPLVAESGIVLNGCTNVMVNNNKIQNVSGYGIVLSGTTDSSIQDNHLIGYAASPKASYNWGISAVIRNTVIPERNIISNNMFFGFVDYGIYLLGSLNSTISNNIINSNGVALRLDAGSDNNTISYNRLNGIVADIQNYAGADFNIVCYNYLANSVTSWEKAGHVRSTAVTTPVGNIVPRFPGQLCLITTGGMKIYMSYGITNTEWLQVG